MSESVGRFLAYNLSPSLVAGLWATLAVAVAAALTRLSSAEIRNELMVLPLIKSTLVLLGVATALPVPSQLWGEVRARAVPIAEVGPWVLLWAGVALVAVEWRRRRAGRRVVASSRRADPESAAARALSRLRRVFARRRGRVCCPGCELPEQLEEPELYLSDDAGSPALVLDRPPRLVLPSRLEAELAADELEAVLAHELAHLWLRRSCGGLCDSARMSSLAWANPTGLLLGGVLARQEELACDEIAAGLTAPDALASALVKTYRSRQRRAGLRLRPSLRLLGGRALLARRLRRLVARPPASPRRSRLRGVVAFALAVVLIFLEVV